MKKNKNKDKDFDSLAPFIYGYGGARVGGLLNKKLIGYAHNKVESKKSNAPLSKINKKFFDFFAKKHKINQLKFNHGVTNYYDALHRKLVLRNYNDLPFLAHELGHAADFKNFGKLKGIFRASSPIVGAAGSTGLLLSDDKEKRKYAPAVYFAGHLPVLYQEGKASVLGLKAIKDFYGSAKAKAASKPLIYGYLTYLGKALLPTLGMYVGSKIYEKNRKSI